MDSDGSMLSALSAARKWGICFRSLRADDRLRLDFFAAPPEDSQLRSVLLKRPSNE
jgi:hypothetical protein